VGIAKFDGYLNLNSGDMNPYHVNPTYKYANEEIFVLEDGSETDADHGFYERFLDENLGSKTFLTNGSFFKKLLEKNIKN
jgi:CTP synthase